MGGHPACHLLVEHLAAFGIKDGRKPGRGQPFEWLPCQDGTVDWVEVRHALRSVGFHGTFVFMPFYDDKDPVAMQAALKSEVAYLRDLFAQAAAEEK